MILDFVYSGSLFTNSNWFAFEEGRTVDEHATAPIASSSPNTEEHAGAGGTDNVIADEDDDVAGTAVSEPSTNVVDGVPTKLLEGPIESETCASEKPPEWVEWRESSDSFENPPPSDPANTSDDAAAQFPSLPNGELQVELEEHQPQETAASSAASVDEPADSCKTESGDAEDSAANPSKSTQSIENVEDSEGVEENSSGSVESEKDDK